VDLGHGEKEGAKGAAADKEGHKDSRGFQFKIFSLCYVTTFDEVGVPAQALHAVRCTRGRVALPCRWRSIAALARTASGYLT
jgi:hypothetical protein